MAKFYLTEADKKAVAEAVRRSLAIPYATPIRTVSNGPLSRTPELFVAKVPTGGIPAMVGLTLGMAACDLYQLQATSSVGDEFELSALLSGSDQGALNVHNPYLRPWFGFSNYIIIHKSKDGVWLCEAPPARYEAALNADLDQGGTSTARVFYYSSGWVDSGEDVDVYEFTLNTDEKFLQYQKGEVKWNEGGVWVFDSPACAVADDTGLFP